MKYDWEYIHYMVPGKKKVDFKAPAIIFVLFWHSFMFFKVFLLLQVKWCAIITYRNAIHELSHELPNDLRLRILGN